MTVTERSTRIPSTARPTTKTPMATAAWQTQASRRARSKKAGRLPPATATIEILWSTPAGGSLRWIRQQLFWKHGRGGLRGLSPSPLQRPHLSIRSSRLSWPDARDQCDEWGYSLITINNEEEDDFASEVLSENELGDTWIGTTIAESPTRTTSPGPARQAPSTRTGMPTSPTTTAETDCVEKREDLGGNGTIATANKPFPLSARAAFSSALGYTHSNPRKS